MKRDEHQTPRTGRFSPLRYPGGKGKMARFVAELIKTNGLSDGTYVEPYAGGAGIAWELLLTGIVRRVEINDISRPIFAFWHAVLFETQALCDRIQRTDVTVSEWDHAKSVFAESSTAPLLELGFATFFLNRTNRSGILNGGIIGGRDQTGPWKIDARYNKDRLIGQIEKIGSVARRVSLFNTDTSEFLVDRRPSWNKKTLLYLDPPYFVKGGQLYHNSYRHSDHAMIADIIHGTLGETNWIVSYDDVDPIRALYGHNSTLRYSIGYSARAASSGAECMFFSPNLEIPAVQGSMVETERFIAA